MGVVSRWVVAVGGSLACFGGCWGGLAAERVLDTGSQVGIASVPLVVVLTVLGAWAERSREKKPQAETRGEHASAEVRDSPDGQAIRQAGTVSGSQGVQSGDGNVQFNFFGGERADKRGDGKEPLKEDASSRNGVLVVGDVPQAPAAFQPRAGLMAALEGAGGSRVSVVFAVTGIRGVGKTQVAAACARRRIAEKWRLVAWVDASDEASVLTGLAEVAVAAGVGPAGEDARELATGVRHWLEADGERRLLVFDNAADLDVLRPFLPAVGAAQVIITSSRRSAAGLGTPVPVDVFTDGEALAFLAERTRLDDVAGARELAADLGFLPLGLAQAAALIAREHLSYGTYLRRLRALPVAGYLGRVEGDAYLYRLAEAIILSLRAAEARDPSGRQARVMGLVAVLAETGVSRRVLYLAASVRVLGRGRAGEAEVDAALGELADASLLGFTVDGSVVAHRLVMRVARERLAAKGKLFGVLGDAVRVLSGLAGGIVEVWRDPAGVRELAEQVRTVATHLASHPNAIRWRMNYVRLLPLRLRSVDLLNYLSDSTGLAILAAEPLVTDCERLLGTDNPYTLTARHSLAGAYRLAGRTAKAIPLHEQALADLERVLGPDRAGPVTARHSLALAYHAAGRTAEAVPLYEQALADFERELGPVHLYTLTARNGLALAYQEAGRTAQAISLQGQTLADSERVLGPGHPNTLAARSNLALAYHAAGRTAEAIPLLEQALADFERELGADHPNTLTAPSNLALAYQAAGRTAEAIPLYERTLLDRERVLGADHPSTLTARYVLALAYQEAGRTAEANSLLEQTLADSKRVLGPDHPHTLGSRYDLALAYHEAGRTAEAIPLLEQALTDLERGLGPDRAGPVTARHSLALAYHAAGRTAEANSLLEQTLAAFERVLGPDHPDTNLIRQDLAALTGSSSK